MKIIRTFESFAGYGSQLMALRRLEREHPDELRVIPVGISEVDKYAIQAYKAVHGDVTNYGDITTIDWAKVPDFDLFTYSSPCQDFSQAGLQRGGEQGSGTRSSLLWECERAIAAKKPKYLLMENVAALVSQKFIKLFNRWQVVLQGYGYKSFPQVLNAKDYGVPQNRERIFLVSILDEEARYEFPKKEKLTRRLKDVLETEVAERYYLNDERVQGLLLSTQSEPLHTDKDGNARTISARYSKESKKKLIENDGKFANTIVAEPMIGAMRGRTDGDWYENDHEQRLETRSDGTSNTITGVQKDNLVAEPTVLGWTRDAQGNVIDRHPVEVANCVTAGKRDNTQNYVQEPANVGKNCHNCCWLTEKWFVDDNRYLHVCKFTDCDIEQALKENPNYVCENWCLAESRQPIQEPAKCNVVAMLPDERLHDSARRIYDTDGLAPTQNTQLGGNHETKIIEPINTDTDGNARTINCHYNDMNAESVMSKPKDGYGYVRTTVVEQKPKIIDDTYKGRKPREYTENAPAIRSEREGFKVVEQEIVIGSMQSNAYRGTTDGPSPSITAACGMGGGQTPMVSVHPLSHKAEFRGFDDEKSPALRATDYKAPVCATDGFRIRKLTPRECFRLMDVSDTDIDKIQAAGISNSQQYKLAGNSIVVACLYHIFRKLFVDTQQENEQLKLF